MRRDLSTVPQRQITFDDVCHLQDYFDQRNATRARPGFRAIEETSNETAQNEPDENGRMRRAVIGEGTYVISDRPARWRFQQLLADEYDRLPALNLTRPGVRVNVRVGWWASGQVRRLRPDRRVIVSVGDQSVDLPFNPCVGEFLFGAPVYALRRAFLDAEAARARGEIPATSSASLPPVEQVGGFETTDAGMPGVSASTDGADAGGG